MSSPARLMAAGIPAGAARQLGIEPAVGTLTATGSNIATALTLNAQFNVFGTVASSAGAQLPTAEAAAPVAIYNGGSNALAVYPQSTEFINAGTAGASFSVTNGKAAIFVPGKNTQVSPAVPAWIAILSA